MSQFPQLKPSSRTLEVASWPVSSFVAMSGKETRVLLGDEAHNHVVSLQFTNVLADKSDAIMAHWADQKGTLIAFTLPETVWAGWAEYSSTISSDLKWRYAGPPTVNAESLGVFTVSVRLVSLS